MQITPFFRTIHAPVVTGVPPANPHRDFMKMPDGELRHYGMRAFRENGKISLTRLVAKSDDCGLNWREEILTSPTVGAMVKSPWSGEYITILYCKGRIRTARSLIWTPFTMRRNNVRKRESGASGQPLRKDRSA